MGIENHPNDLYYCIRHRNVIVQLQQQKNNIIRIPKCNTYGPFYASARMNYCYHGLPNGLIMFWTCFVFFVGCMCLVAALFRQEMVIKYKHDRRMQGPSQFGNRYMNYQLTSLVKYTQADKRDYRKDEQL